MLKLLMIVVTLVVATLTEDLKTIIFNESFTCSYKGRINTVRVRVCEYDSFSGPDCTEWVQQNCGKNCTIPVTWADYGDEWPGTEFEFVVEYMHSCNASVAGRLFHNPVADYFNIPIDGPAVRNRFHCYNLDNLPPQTWGDLTKKMREIQALFTIEPTKTF